MVSGLFIDQLREMNGLSIALRLFLSIICGGLIGLERGARHQAAGFRTHILVCIGACMTMITGQYIYQYITPTADPARLGAQVINGIGFLGAGTIITTSSNKVRGLTTAAGLWAAACIGLSLGIGLYEAAFGGTLAVLLAVIVLRKIDVVLCTKVSHIERPKSGGTQKDASGISIAAKKDSSHN